MTAPPEDPRIRPIEARDDPVVAGIIESVLTSFELERYIPEQPNMSIAFARAGAEFFVLDCDGRVLGCGGFEPLPSMAADGRTCELQKMYLLPELRGRGVGRQFLQFLLGRMAAAGYARVYLVTSTKMLAAQALYRSLGFRELEEKIGDAEPGGCDRHFIREL